MNAPTRSVPLALALALGGCRAPATVADRLPDSVPRAALSSTIWVGNPSEEGVAGYGSAVILGPRQLLTSAHQWAVAEPWWAQPLPAERELELYEPARAARVRVVGLEGELRLPARTRRVPFRLVAAGTPALAAGPDGEGTRVDGGDWVLLETDALTWAAADAATPHPAAAEPGWRVPEGSELLIAGYASIFMENGKRREDDAAPSPWERLVAFLEGGPYVIAGAALELDGDPAITYPLDWPAPHGHSGGGVYLWQPDEQRALLVGLFHTHVPVRATIVQRYEPLGISALGFERTTERECRALRYEPLASALQATDDADGSWD